ncbi:MAG: phage tail tape measure protein [Synergistaceae bacterium]|nr:phage tail tape measure protein [Synergistaceae bacterium]
MGTSGALGLITKNALNIGGGFEAQMTAVKVISGAAENELDALTKKAREMGATLPITAKDAAQAMTLLAQRGNDAHKILASVQAVANLSISQAVDMASAADILGSTITNFAMSVDEADKITAIFNNACNQSALNMSKLIEAMKYVGPAANSVKMPLTEAVAAMEAIANAGLTGEMTGTGLAMVLTKLAMKANISGVETKNLDNSMRSLSDIFLELSKREYTLANAVADFGQRGSKAALALINNAASLARNEERLKQWSSTQNAVNEKMKTFTNTLNAFRSASEELHIEIFEQIKNQAKDAVGSLANITRAFSKWIGETQIAGDTLNAFLEGLGFKLPSVENFQSLLKNFNIQGFLDNIKSFGAALKGIADSIVWAFGMIKAPLGFLIEHLRTFATISFWGWIGGKALQVPAALTAIAASFTKFKTAVLGLQAISWASLITNIKTFINILLSPANANAFLINTGWAAIINPITATIAALTTLGYKYGTALAEIKKANEDFDKVIKGIKKEIQDADTDLLLHIEFNIDTGFEDIPKAYIKAADETRKLYDERNKEAQKNFKDTFSEALKFVIKQFPELVDEAQKAGININNVTKETFAQITAALHGNKEAYKGLPNIFQKVTEHINQVNMALGKGNSALYYTIIECKNLQRELDKMKPQNKVKTFFEEMNASLRNVLLNIPAQIDEANKYLRGSNGQLAIQVSLKQAQDALNKFVKEAADKYAIPEDIVKQPILNSLKELAVHGNKTAKLLYEAWGDVDKHFNEFLDSAKDAINYLGEAPQSFVPALTHLINGIQRIDPITGKLTEKFKKAHDALKEWANVTFDKLTNRIQKLRKAVEGGFIDKSELEKEFKNVMPQIKLQVISELEPFEEQFNSKNAYAATLASDYINKVIDIFGDAGEEMVKKIYQGMSGAEIGKAILRDNQRSLSGGNNTIAYINGIEQGIIKSVNSLADTIGALYFNLDHQKGKLTTHEYEVNDNIFSFSIAETVDLFSKEISQFAGDFGERARGVADSFSSTLAPVNSTIQLLNNTLDNNTNTLSRAGDSMLGLINSIQTPSSNSNVSIKDYSAEFASVIKALDNINSSAQANINAVNSVGEAVRAINFQPVNEENIAMSILNGFTPVLNALDKFQSSTENASANISTLTSSIETLRKSTDNNISALGNLQAAISSSGGEQNISGAIVGELSCSKIQSANNDAAS